MLENGLYSNMSDYLLMIKVRETSLMDIYQTAVEISYVANVKA